jgi:hypothetical protein
MKHLVLCGATLLLLGLGCSRTPSNSELFNEPAAVPAGAPLQVLQWKTITSSIDAPHETMSILFGNDVAIESARSGKQAEYPAGSVLSLVTWSQQEDKHWFGARIPKDFKTMEVVKVSAGADGKASTSYERYEGQARVASEDDERRAYILEQRASVMP